MQDSARARSGGVCLDAHEREALKCLIAAIGDREAAEQLALNRATLWAAVGGRPLRKSTVRLVQVGLAQAREGR